MENEEIKISMNCDDIIDIEKSLKQRILSDNTISNDITSNSTSYIVYYKRNIPLGYLAFLNCIDHIDIISLAVKPEYRRQGIATLLFGYLEKLNTQGLKIFLEVRESNLSAISFYNSLNFNLISTRKNYYSAPTENALILVKE